MITKTLGIALIATLGSLSATAGATTIDFNSLHKDGNLDYNYVQGPYREDGFTLNAANCQGSLGVPNAGCFVSTQRYHSFDKAGATLTTQFVSTATTVTRDNGAAFFLQSLDFSEYNDNGIYGPTTTNVNFTFLFADNTTGAVTRTFSNDGAYLPTTFTFDLAALKSFSWTPITGSGVQFDNIVLNDVAAAVPEPATWAMMLVGFGMVGGATRYRRRKSVAAFA